MWDVLLKKTFSKKPCYNHTNDLLIEVSSFPKIAKKNCRKQIRTGQFRFESIKFSLCFRVQLYYIWRWISMYCCIQINMAELNVVSYYINGVKTSWTYSILTEELILSYNYYYKCYRRTKGWMFRLGNERWARPTRPPAAPPPLPPTPATSPTPSTSPRVKS